MWHVLGAMRRNLQNMRKSPRVADESMLAEGNGDELISAQDAARRQQGWNGLKVMYSIVQAPLSLLSCLSHSHINGAADGVWASGELARISEINHLMVSDSVRYAILM